MAIVDIITLFWVETRLTLW